MCVILFTEINGKYILAKNRDRPYSPLIEIHHEIVNGTEVVYIQDRMNGWIEGMNAHGVGIVNSTLSRIDRVERPKMFKQKNTVYHLLTSNKIEPFLTSHAVEGHSIIFYEDKCIHVENAKGEFITEPITPTKVYSNKGVHVKNTDMSKCTLGMSSFLRATILKKEVDKKIKNIDQLAEVMNMNYTNIHPHFHPYRETSQIKTTGQLFLNMSDLEFTYLCDKNNSQGVTYINQLPTEYVPKIKVIIQETQKNKQRLKKMFTQKYLDRLKKKYYCKTQKSVVVKYSV